LHRRLYRKRPEYAPAPRSVSIDRGKATRARLESDRIDRAWGLVTYYTMSVLDLATRFVQILASTRHPDARFMLQMARALVFPDEGLLAHHRVLLCAVAA
jgi:hypothetical protein